MIVFADLYDSNTGKEDLDLSNDFSVEGVGTFAATFVGVAKGVSPSSAILEGRLQFSMPTVCDRCFDGFTYASSINIEVYVTLETEFGDNQIFEGGEEEHYNALESLDGSRDSNNDNNDSQYYCINTPEFDPWEIIGEELMLSLPHRYVCSSECVGTGVYSVGGDDAGSDDAGSDDFGSESVRMPFKNLDAALGRAKKGSKR